MRGHVRKRGQKWAVVVDIGHDENGKRLRKWHSGFDRRRDAERELAEILRRLDRGDYVEPASLTVERFLTDEWLPGVRATLKPSTFESYAMICRARIVPHVGAVRLQRLAPAALNAMYGDLAKAHKVDGEKRPPLSARSIRYTHAVCHRAFADACKWGRLQRNPAEHATPPAAKSAPMRTWSADELAAFLEHVRDDRLYALWRLAATTGARRGEVLGTRWPALDLDAGRWSIAETLIGRKQEETPKRDASRRSVALDSETVAALRAHADRQADEIAALGPAYRERGFVFCREDGEPMYPASISRAFKRHVAAAALPPISLKGLRHTHATLALAAGVHPKVVQERLGHSSIAVTMDTYSHVTPAMAEDAAATVAALIE